MSLNEYPPSGYDIYHLGASGGKDSVAAMLWLIYMSDIPYNRIVISMCDTGNEDNFTYAFINMLNERIFPITIIKPKRDFWELAKWKKRFPSRCARFCSQHLKVIPSINYLQSLPSQNILNMTGLRKEEGRASNNRGSIPQYEPEGILGYATYHPVLYWSIDEVWSIHKQYLKKAWVNTIVMRDPDMHPKHKAFLLGRMGDIPRNPLYDMGSTRVGCYPCITSSKLELRSLVRYRPERIDLIAKEEKKFDGINGISTFFARNAVPERFRTKEIVTQNGETMKVATIKDVARWSQTVMYKPDQIADDPTLPNKIVEIV